jgi:ferric-dicitrate binding protein FerR (iron transport regulator)
VFVANKTPLWRMVQVLNEAYDAQIVIEREELRNLPLTTTFKNQPLDTILSVISETLHLQVVKTDDRIILK